MASLIEIMQALADQIDGVLHADGTPLIEDLQVLPVVTWNPTPPTIDIYPWDPLQEEVAFGGGNSELSFTVRARVDTPDTEGAQTLLLSMMDPTATTSVAQALYADRTLDGTISTLMVEGPSEFGEYVNPDGKVLLGCRWHVTVLP